MGEDGQMVLHQLKETTYGNREPLPKKYRVPIGLSRRAPELDVAIKSKNPELKTFCNSRIRNIKN